MNDNFQYSGLFHRVKFSSHPRKSRRALLNQFSALASNKLCSPGASDTCFLISPTENLPWEGWNLTPSLSKLQMISQKAHPSFYSTIVSQNSQGVYINKKISHPTPFFSINCKFSLNFCLNSTRHLFGLTHRIQYLIHLIQINMFFFLLLFYKPTITTSVYQHRL